MVEKHWASCRGAVVSPRCLLPHTLVLRPTWMPVEGVARNEGDARGRGGAARRGRGDGETRGGAGGGGRNDGAARRGEAWRGAARGETAEGNVGDEGSAKGDEGGGGGR